MLNRDILLIIVLIIVRGNMNNGYIRLHRKFLEWEWLQNPNDVSLFIHLLLMTNWKDSKYKDIDVLRGSLVTGRKELAKKVGVSEQQIRTSLNQQERSKTCHLILRRLKKPPKATGRICAPFCGP